MEGVGVQTISQDLHQVIPMRFCARSDPDGRPGVDHARHAIYVTAAALPPVGVLAWRYRGVLPGMGALCPHFVTHYAVTY